MTSNNKEQLVSFILAVALIAVVVYLGLFVAPGYF